MLPRPFGFLRPEEDFGGLGSMAVEVAAVAPLVSVGGWVSDSFKLLELGLLVRLAACRGECFFFS